VVKEESFTALEVDGEGVQGVEATRGLGVLQEWEELLQQRVYRLQHSSISSPSLTKQSAKGVITVNTVPRGRDFREKEKEKKQRSRMRAFVT
jgi:hypothetical protein